MSDENEITCAEIPRPRLPRLVSRAQEPSAVKRKTDEGSTACAADEGLKKLKTDSGEQDDRREKDQEMKESENSVCDDQEVQNNHKQVEKKNETEETKEGVQLSNSDIKEQQSSVQPQSARKRKCVLLLAYCGEGYNGMQRNPDVKTIEDDLINALYKAGAITEDAKDNLGKMSFQRAARTDKGVSAARQIVSLKMVPVEGVVDLVNNHLPPVIRVFTYRRTTKAFDSKNSCSARTYEYLLPTFAFAPSLIATRKDYRMTDDVLEKVNEILRYFIGTHNYHNFTSGKKPNDPSSKRYIMKFECDKPFEKDGMEFAVLRIKGQSFMLHQIRKMIGLTIAIVRNHTNKDAIERAWQEPKMDVPRAPGLGLMLDQVHFDHYNKKYGKDGIHEPLEWEEFEDGIKKFKDDFIYQRIIEVERNQSSMMRWLNTLTNHSYSSEGMDQPKSLETRTSSTSSVRSIIPNQDAVEGGKVTADQEVS